MVIIKIGCSITGKKSAAIDPESRNEQEIKLIGKLKDLNTQRGVGSNAELELIHQTFMHLQNLDPSRRKNWIQAIHNDILTPIYFSTVENFKYNASNPFQINPSLLEDLKHKDYESIKKTKEELREGLLHIFNEYVNAFNIDILKLQRFILAICENYQDNPFHNFYHAFSVVQMIFSLAAKNKNFERFFDSKETFALLVSALGHDLNHPGVTNIFMINSRHPLAVRYNDISVLENHHAATLIKFLELPGCDIFTGSLCDETSMRKIIIPTILATDMAKHNFVLEHFVSSMRNFDKNSVDHRQSVSDVLLHACDIGNPVLKFDLSTIWSLKIIQEFNDQVWKEEELKIPVSEYMRIGSDINKIKRNQIGFIDMFIHPLWMVLSQHIEGSDEYSECIENNRKSWELIEKL